MNKNYTIEFLYDNGLKESYDTGEITKEDLQELLTVVNDAFREGESAVLRMPNKYGLVSFVNVGKVTRVVLKEAGKLTGGN